MLRRHLAAFAIAFAALTDPVNAELRGAPEGPPTFTASEVAVIARNRALAGLVQDNPWVVRRVLDEWAKLNTGAADPDLDALERASPEGLLDLLKILKEAEKPKQQSTSKRN